MIHIDPEMPQRNDYARGSNTTAIGDLSRSLHDFMPQFLVTELERIGATYLTAKKCYKSTAGIYMHVPQPFLGTAAVEKAFRLIDGILPALLSTPVEQDSARILQFKDSSRPGGVES